MTLEKVGETPDVLVLPHFQRDVRTHEVVQGWHSLETWSSSTVRNSTSLRDVRLLGEEGRHVTLPTFPVIYEGLTREFSGERVVRTKTTTVVVSEWIKRTLSRPHTDPHSPVRGEGLLRIEIHK